MRLACRITALHTLLEPTRCLPACLTHCDPHYLCRVLGLQGALKSCAVGISGVIFALMVVDNAIEGTPKRLLFGRFEVPAPWVPWIMLFLIQIIVPRASFLGHLCGLLVGEAWVSGRLASLQLSDMGVATVEGHPVYDEHAAKLGVCVPAQVGAPPLWQVVQSRANSVGYTSTSSLEAAWVAAQQLQAAAAARIPAQTQEQAWQAVQRAKVAAAEKWQRLLVALPPPVVSAGMAAHAAVTGFVRQHIVPVVRPYYAGPLDSPPPVGGSDDGDEEASANERLPLLYSGAAGTNIPSGGLQGAQGLGVTHASPARRPPRPAGANPF